MDNGDDPGGQSWQRANSVSYPSIQDLKRDDFHWLTEQSNPEFTSISILILVNV